MESTAAISSVAVNAVATGLVVGAGAWLLLRKQKPPPGLIEPPTAAGHWLLGHIPYLSEKDFHRRFVKLQWADELGAVYKIWIGGPAVIVSDASLAAPLMSRGPEYLGKSGLAYAQSTWLSYNTHSIFNEPNDNDPMWKRIRKATAVCFAVEHIKKIFPQVLAKTNAMMNIWTKMLVPGPHGSTGTVVQIDNWIKRCVLASMLGASFNIESVALEDDEHNCDNEFLHVLHELLQELSSRLANPLRGPMQSPSCLRSLMPFLATPRRIQKLTLRFQEMIEVMFDKIQAKAPYPPDNQTLGAVLSRLLEPGADGPAMPKAQVLGNLGTFIVGSFDTSASAISWALYNIASHPDVQQRCINELHDAGLLHVEGKPAPRPLAWEDLTAMPYLQATLKESMRYHTTPATGTVRETTKDVAIGKYWVPKGTIVWIPFVCIHESKINFTDPRKFDPNRWLTTDSTKALAGQGDDNTAPVTGKVESRPTLSGNAANLQKSFLTFSTGPRDCVGQSLANISSRTMIMSILSRFHLSVHPDTGTPEEVERDQMMSLVMVPGRPIKLVLTPHTQTTA